MIKMENNKKYSKILIIGLGLIGGSYAQGLSKKGFNLYALNRSQKAIDYAINNNYIIDGFTFDNIPNGFLSSFDYIIMGLYPKAMMDFLNLHKDELNKNVIITDVCGVKQVFINDVQNLIDGEFIGAHPMAGREVSGIENADYHIFKDANYIITPTEKNTEKGINFTRMIGEELEFRHIAILSPQKHDEMIAYLSQLTHCIAVTLMTSRNSEQFINYTGDSFRDLTRIAKINENMWCELFLENKKDLLSQMDLFIKEILKLREAIEKEDQETIKNMMKLSTERRKKFDNK